MPEDMDSSNSDREEKEQKGGIYADIDFNSPLEPHENLPVQQHRIVTATPKKEETPTSNKKERRHRRHRGEKDDRKHKDGKHRSSRHRDKHGKEDKSGRSRSSSNLSNSSQPQGKPAHIRSYEAGPRLIDIGGMPEKAPSSPAVSVTAAPASPNLLESLQSVPPSTNYDQISSPSIGGGSSPAPMSNSYSQLPEVPPSVPESKSSQGRRDEDGRRRKDEKSSRSRDGKKTKKEKDIFADYKKERKQRKQR